MRRKGKRVEGKEATASSLLPTRSARATRLRATPLLSFFAIATCVIYLFLILARNGPQRNLIANVLGQPERDHINATFSHRINPDDAIKLDYLSLIYNEQVDDPSLFDELQVIYRKTAIPLPDHLIPCNTFVYGFDCIGYYHHECGPHAYGGSGNDQTFLAEAQWPQESAAAEDGGWLEVTHWGMPEGDGYGCFFNVRKGTGVWMNVGKTVVVRNDTHAKQYFQEKLGEDVQDRDATKFANYCPYALKLGYDTVQITDWVDPWLSMTASGASNGGHGVHQLIQCSGKCETEPVESSCIPGVEFRSGLDHGKPCKCDESISILNCGNNIAPKLKRVDFCTMFSLHSPNGTFLTHQHETHGQLGPKLQDMLGVWALSKHLKVEFCTKDAKYGKRIFGFDRCPQNADVLPFDFDKVSMGTADRGFFLVGDNTFSSGNNGLGVWSHIERATGDGAIWNRNLAKEWMGRLTWSVEKAGASEMLWESDDSIKVAVHLLRGDVMCSTKRKEFANVYIPDEEMKHIIEQTRSELWAKFGAQTQMEVHLFSEAENGPEQYVYGDLVDHFHLFDAHDEKAILRGYHHFALADVAIIGGTFSAVPALARSPPDVSTGLPITKAWRGHPGYFEGTSWRGPSWWTQHELKEDHAIIKEKFIANAKYCAKRPQKQPIKFELKKHFVS